MSTNTTPIKGYTPLSDEQRALGNAFKEIEEALKRLVDQSRSTDLDQRWISIAMTHFEEGFHALNRANFKPQRIDGPIDAGAVFDTAAALLKSRHSNYHNGSLFQAAAANYRSPTSAEEQVSASSIRLSAKSADGVSK